MNLLFIAMFSTEGGISKDYLSYSKHLSEMCNVYSVVNRTDFDISAPGEKGRLILDIGKQNIFGIINIKNYLRLRQFARVNKIDRVFIWSHTIFNYFAVRVLRKIDIFAFLHNPVPHAGQNRIKTLLETLVNHDITKRARKVFVASYYQMEKLKNNSFYSKYICKVRVQYLGLQESMIIEPVSKRKDIDVLFFGRLEYYKGVDVLIEAMRSLSTINCTIIGKGQCNFSKPSNVNIINQYIPDDELAEYIDRCKVGCLPYREATGTAIVQTYYFHSIPVIVTNTGCLGEYVTNGYNGIVVEPEDVDELKRAICELISNTSMQMEMSMNAKKSVENFKYDYLSKKLFNEIEGNNL